MNYQTNEHKLVNVRKTSNGDLIVRIDVIIPKDDASQEFIDDVSTMYEKEVSELSPLQFGVKLLDDCIHITKSIKNGWSDDEIKTYFENNK